jgi:hypothetical protein
LTSDNYQPVYLIIWEKDVSQERVITPQSSVRTTMTSIGLLRSLRPPRNPNNVNPLEQAQALLGEHYRNYIIVAQPEDAQYSFEFVNSDPFATTGLLQEANKYHQAVMNTFQDPEDSFEWVTDDEDDEDDDYE